MKQIAGKSAAAAKAQELRREIARQKQVITLARQLSRVSERANLETFQAARAIVTDAGWSVVKGEYVRELETMNERLTAEVDEYRAERTAREEAAAASASA